MLLYILFLVLPTPVIAYQPGQIYPGTFEWSMKIVYPDNEAKSFVVMPSGGKISLGDVQFKCSYDPITSMKMASGSYAEQINFNCIFRNNLLFGSNALCTSTGILPTFESGKLILADMVTKKTWLIIMTCQKRPL